MIPEPQIPTYEDLLWPTLKALESIGGSASIQELSSRVAMDMALPDEILDVLHKDGPQTEVDYRAAWARTHLRMVGATDNTARGVWTITDRGRDVQSEEQARELVRNIRSDRYKAKKTRGAKAPERAMTDADDDQDWESALLGILRSMAPDAFERLCQRILRESGFTRVEVTGRSGDGGIDGAGVLRVNLILSTCGSSANGTQDRSERVKFAISEGRWSVVPTKACSSPPGLSPRRRSARPYATGRLRLTSSTALICEPSSKTAHSV